MSVLTSNQCFISIKIINEIVCFFCILSLQNLVCSIEQPMFLSLR